MVDRTVREAQRADHEAVAAFTEDTWARRDVGDYIPEAFPEWVDDDPDGHTVVTEVGGEPVGVARARMLTPDEAWLQGLRVHPDHRGRGHAGAMTDALLAWCRDRGATVARNMVFGWNDAGIGQSRAAGLVPGPACRWARPDPASGDSTASVSELSIREDSDAAWRYWTHSETRSALDGLALDDDGAWALAELTRDRFERLTERERTIAVVGENTRGMTVRRGSRDGEDGTVVDYAVAAWADAEAGEALFDAIRADAAACGGDRTRVLIPESPRYVSDAALARARLSDHPLYTFVADLTGDTAAQP